MKYFQDLEKAGQDEAARMSFIQSAITEHKASREYTTALTARMYYDGENPTINRYEKLVYDSLGKAHRDIWTANHKIASRFFGFAVDQLTSYLLGNGVTFDDEATKGKLGADFDKQVMDAAREAQIGGQAFGFFNVDHVEVFGEDEFAPLYDERTSALRAGIRFWQLASDKPECATLYEQDGYTEYIKPTNEGWQVEQEKQAYKLTVISSPADGREIVDGRNYDGFPIVPLYNNDKHKSEIVGRQNTIDALDLITSNMVNNVDEGNLIYWVLQNCDGMDELDDAEFIRQLKQTHVAHAGNSGGAGSVQAQTVEAPFTGSETTAQRIKKQLYEDFQALDIEALTASNQTATAIKLAYARLDLKADKFEAQVTDWILGLLKLAGVDDKPTYTRNRVINTQDEIQTLLQAAQYLTDDYITRKVLTILGDADKADDMLEEKSAEDLERFSAQPVEEPEVSEDGET
jgi:SPP1 family phage portal protein